jgi:hypothetical protein
VDFIVFLTQLVDVHTHSWLVSCSFAVEGSTFHDVRTRWLHHVVRIPAAAALTIVLRFLAGVAAAAPLLQALAAAV